MLENETKPTEQKLLTEVELELMTILWRIEEGTVAEVIELLPAGRNLAYTSVSTILRILEQKNILGTRKAGRGHIYRPNILKSDYEAKTLNHIIQKVFDGTPAALVRQLVSSNQLNDQDFEEIVEEIEKQLRNKVQK